MSETAMQYEQACPRCKTNKYRNPSLKLMVNVCGHSLCENCVELLFIRGSGACQECGTALRRSNFRLQMFEDPFVEKEVDIRKRMLKDFNKKEEDFDTLRDFNDYLEMVETLIFNLANEVDVEDTKYQIECYKRENAENIKRNRIKLSRDAELIEELIESEQAETAYYREKAAKKEREEQQAKKKNKDSLIDDLMFSGQSAQQVMESHRREQQAKQQLELELANIPRERQTQFSTGVRMGKQKNVFLPVPRADAVECFSYIAPSYECNGPVPPDTPALQNHSYRQALRPISPSFVGGGYTMDMALKRCLQDAFAGLFFSFDSARHHSQSDESMDYS